MDGYYEPHALVALERPIVISGMIPAETRKVSYRLASRYGLRWVDLDQQLEHELGASMQEWKRLAPAHELERMRSQAVSSALAASPPAVISVPDVALSSRATLRQVRTASFFVALAYTAEDCFGRFKKLYVSSAPEWIRDAPGPGSLESLYGQWNQRFRNADLEIPMQGATWEVASRRLEERLLEVHPSFAN